MVVARGKNLRMHASNAFAREGDARAGAGPAETQKLTERPGEGDAGRLPAWRAHDGVVLAVDWCAVSGRLVSGGEDRKYKVWDAHGRALFSCAERDHAITSVAWSPSGAHFAAGAYDAVWLCDGAGWSRATTSNTALGSTLDLAWSGDGRTVAGACAKAPGVFVGTVVDVERACDECVARLAKPRAMSIRDAKAKSASRDATIETRDRVGAFSFEHGHLLLGVGTKVLVYERGKWGAPKASAELGGVATFLAQSRDGFAAAAAGVSGFVARCFSYDGRKTCDVPFAAARTRWFTSSPSMRCTWRSLRLIEASTLSRASRVALDARTEWSGRSAWCVTVVCVWYHALCGRWPECFARKPETYAAFSGHELGELRPGPPGYGGAPVSAGVHSLASVDCARNGGSPTRCVRSGLVIALVCHSFWLYAPR